MTDRRKFLQSTGAAALTSLLPGALPAADRQLPTRQIPGTDERLAVVGLGNSRAFKGGDAEVSQRLLSTFFGHGGSYVDCGGEGAYLVASIAGTLGFEHSAFVGSYFSGEYRAQSEAAANRLRAIKGGRPLDLMHTYPEDGVPNWDVFRGWKEAGLTRHIGLARHNVRYYDAMMKVMQTGTMDFVQVNLSPLESEAEDRILPMAQKYYLF